MSGWKRTIAILGALVLWVSSSAQAVAPDSVSHSQVIADGSGHGYTGTKKVTFRLYTAATGGSVSGP
jgi:hypothetical protein